MRLPIDESQIPEEDQKNQTVLLQLEIIRQQAEQIQQLKDEIARLKGHGKRPNIKPSRLEKNKAKKRKTKKGKRPGSQKRSKTAELQIHADEPVEPDHIPPGSRFIEYRDFVVQNIKLEAHNIRYRLKVYEAPGGQYVVGKLPEYLDGKHFGPELICFILYQHYHCHVTQPLLWEQLYELGIDISKGQLSNILIEGKERYHQEKEHIIAAGLQVSSCICVDDTGARHNGKNGYCTHIGNDMFSWFESTDSKSRINFLKLLRAGHSDYFINVDAIVYMQTNRLPQYIVQSLINHFGWIFANDEQWDTFLAQNGIFKEHHIRIATQGALIGSIIENGINKHLVIMSDDAGQFNVLRHALCWIHAERTIDKITVFSDEARQDLDSIKDRIWTLYEGLKHYKEQPNKRDKQRLKEAFDDIFTSKTHSASLNNALKRIHQNKAELLLVLERPYIPLHNNLSENAIREYVKRRKISGSTRSVAGRRARDTFISLKKTCRKLGISFWDYLKDRIENQNSICNLSDLIRQQALDPG